MIRLLLLAFILLNLGGSAALAQFGGGGIGGDFRGNLLESRRRNLHVVMLTIGDPNEHGDRMLTFRTRGTPGQRVQIVSPDLFHDQESGIGPQMTETQPGEFSLTIGPVPAGVYHYLGTNEPGNECASVILPGKTLVEALDVPHGVVAELTRYSPQEEEFMRFHVYTPPGYEENDQSYPTLFLLWNHLLPSHSWIEIGRLNFILDNLIAQGRAQPMIVVVVSQPESIFDNNKQFRAEVIPYVEKNYRLKPGPENRAIAGCGEIEFALDADPQFAYLACFDSPFSIAGRNRFDEWVGLNNWKMRNDDIQKNVRLIWFGDQLHPRQNSNIDRLGLLLAEHKLPVEVFRSDRPNIWQSRREYFADLLPRLFQK